jgi:predicted secreted hydrolase
MKNECGKTRAKNNPYEVWVADGWTWNVLKKYKSPDGEAKDAYARWFCFVTSPMCPYGEMGDVYVSEIKGRATKIA